MATSPSRPSTLQVTSVTPPSDCAAHQELALDAARQGIVLLKNEKQVLPLNDTVRSIALLGPNAAATYTLQGNYYGNAPYLVSPIQGFSTYAKVNYAAGCDIASNSTAGFTQACNIAETSDVTILVMGIDQSQVTIRSSSIHRCRKVKAWTVLA